MGLSRRAYAAMRGVHESAVRKAIASGRIVVEEDGTIDPVKADALWDTRTDPSQQRGAHARDLANKTSAAVRAIGGTKAVPKQALAAVAATLNESGEAGPPDDPSAAGDVSFVKARMANEILKAQTARERLKKMRGEVVDRSRAMATVFDLARRERDAWLNWPPRVAADMAAELAVDPHAMEQLLGRYIRRHLSEMSEARVEFR